MKKFTGTLAMGAAVAVFSLTLGAEPVLAFGGMGGGNPAAAAGDAGGGPSGGMSVMSGKVVETMDAGGYTYMLLEKGDSKAWVAAPSMKVKVGENVVMSPGMAMPNFKSDSLNRTFEVIYFSPGVVTLPGTKADKTAKTAEDSPKPAGATVKVDKAEGAGACTVGEAYADAEKLAGKTVSVKGKVTKVSQGIMGSNWLHLQDGTGDIGKGTGDLVVTTDEMAEVDDVVTVTGTLAKDKDFGYGYKYDVIVEKATISK